MDLLYQRYASPFSFINGMLQTGRFAEFVVELIQTTNKEKEDKARWDIYLHKVFDKSFDEWNAEIENNKSNQEMSAGTIETTVQNSLNILQNFNPIKGGEEN